MVKVRKRDLIRVFLRSFFIQSSWNYERMLGLGFCFCLIPIARSLFTDKNEMINFLKRHLDFFNSHPYIATYALGAVINIEEQAINKQWTDTRPIEIFKSRIISPLGSIGDILFWQLIRPGIALIGIISLLLWGIWGIFIFLLLYNIPHFFIRIRGLFKSYMKGFDIVRDLSLRGSKKYFDAIKIFFSVSFGICTVFLISHITKSPLSWRGLVVFLSSTFISYFIVKKQRIPIDLLMIIFIFSSIIIGLMI